jgi:hypothetical protein
LQRVRATLRLSWRINIFSMPALGALAHLLGVVTAGDDQAGLGIRQLVRVEDDLAAGARY